MSKRSRLQKKGQSKGKKSKNVTHNKSSGGDNTTEASVSVPTSPPIQREQEKPKISPKSVRVPGVEFIKSFIYRLTLLFKKANKIVLLCIVIAISCVAGFFYLKQSHSSTIKSTLTQVKEIELHFKDFQSQNYSPVCGCYKEQRPEDWRGIAFATRHLKFERKGRLPLTAYMITVAAPERISFSSSGYRFSADLYFISVPTDESFDPKLVVSNNIPDSYQVIEKKHFDPKRYFMIFSDKGLNVNLLGDKPLGAWIPSDGAKVKIGYSKGMFPASKTTASISEEYNIRATESLLQEIVGVPMGDFLGPNIVLWTDDAKLSILAGKDMISVPSSGNQYRVITALIANPPFSLRVACLPEDSDAVSVYRDILSEKIVENAEEDYLTMVRHPEDESGVVNVVIPDVEESAEEFAEVYGKMKENDVVKIPNVPGDFIARDYDSGKEIGRFKDLGWMKFRYPPIPPNAGFNVFGSFSSIIFNQVRGHIVVGSRTLDINVPSKLELQDINSLEVEGGVIQVPIRWDTKESVANIQLHATAQTKLNGEPLAKGFDTYRQHVEYILLLSSILSTIGAVIQIVLARRSLKQRG